MTQAPPPGKSETHGREGRVIGGHYAFATTVPDYQTDNGPRKAVEFCRI